MEKTFKVRRTMKALNTKRAAHVLCFHLTRSLVWAFLDQAPGDRSSRRKKTINARYAGALALADRAQISIERLAKTGRQPADEIDFLKEFINVGGIRALTSGESSNSLCDEFSRQEKNTRIVFRVVEYVCRAMDAGFPDRECSITAAQKFILERRDVGLAFSKSAITQAWERYAPGAALIFAAYTYWPDLSSNWQAAKFKYCFERLSKNKTEMQKFLGYVGYAAVALSRTQTDKAFTRSFSGLRPVQPALAAFTPNDVKLIRSINQPTRARG